MRLADLDAVDPAALVGAAGGRFALVTLVHLFDRFADPVAALRRLRELVTDDGRVFLRLPDHAIDGKDRFMQRAHFDVAPLHALVPRPARAVRAHRATASRSSGPGRGRARANATCSSCPSSASRA